MNVTFTTAPDKEADMTTNLATKRPIRQSGTEPFHSADTKSIATLLDFWRWAYSDLLRNTSRGRLAEFIVARALELGVDDVRTEWDTVDLVTGTGVKIEVKSGAYLQSWFQNKLSKIIFDVSAKRGWDATTNQMDSTPRRHADVYVFALLAHQDKSSIDPLNLAQWTFYVLPTASLNSRKRSQHSVTLKSLSALCPGPITFVQLREAIERAAALKSTRMNQDVGLGNSNG
jgi:hypothetical protein